MTRAECAVGEYAVGKYVVGEYVVGEYVVGEYVVGNYVGSSPLDAPAPTEHKDDSMTAPQSATLRRAYVRVAIGLVLCASAACDDGADATALDADLTSDAGSTADAMISTLDQGVPDAAVELIRDRYHVVEGLGRTRIWALRHHADTFWLGTDDGLFKAEGDTWVPVTPVQGDAIIYDIGAAPFAVYAGGSLDGKPLILKLSDDTWRPTMFDMDPHVVFDSDAPVTAIDVRGDEVHFIVDQVAYRFDPNAVLGSPNLSSTLRSLGIWGIEHASGDLFLTTERGPYMQCGARWCHDTEEDPLAPVSYEFSALRAAGGALYGLGDVDGLFERAGLQSWLPVADPLVQGRAVTGIGRTDDQLLVSGTDLPLAVGQVGALAEVDLGLPASFRHIAIAPAPAGGHVVWLSDSFGTMLRCEGDCLTPAAACTDCGVDDLVGTANWGEPCAIDRNCEQSLVCDPRLMLCADCVTDDDCAAGTCAMGRCR